MQRTATSFPPTTQYASPAELGSPLQMGVVELNVQNLEAVKNFYAHLVGLAVLTETSDRVTLGSGDQPVLVLHHTPDLPPAPLGSAGLYHTALLFSTRAALAQAIERVLTSSPHLFEGSADHLVSEAFYFHDPEGNGVELYVDREPSTWQWQDGSVVMASEYLDPAWYIQMYGVSSVEPQQSIGHVHLRVGDMQTAQDFYVRILGFSPTAQMPSALFVSDGQYHHHLGMNVWQSAGAGVRQETLGLRQFSVVLPNSQKLHELTTRLQQAGISFDESSGGVAVRDPWGTKILFTSHQ